MAMNRKQAIETTQAMKDAMEHIRLDIFFRGAENWKSILKQRIMGLARTAKFTSAQLVAIALPIRNDYTKKV